MRKIFLLIIFGLFLPLNIYAFGSFQLLDFSSLPSGISGQPYDTTINFVYSGDWIPSASLVGQSLPSGIKITDFYTGKNGVGSFKLKGTPSGNGMYKINFLLTDNNGATLLKTSDFFIEDGTSVFKVKSNLPKAFKGVDYKGQITIDYLGEEKPNVYYSGVPVGVFVNRDDFPAIGRGSVQLSFYGAPTRQGNYPISFKVWNEKENEVKSYSIIVEDSVKVEVPISQPEQKILRTEIVQQKVVEAPVKKEQKKITPTQEVIKQESKDVVIIATATQNIIQTTATPSKEVEKTENSSLFKKIRGGIKSFLLKLVNII